MTQNRTHVDFDDLPREAQHAYEDSIRATLTVTDLYSEGCEDDADYAALDGIVMQIVRKRHEAREAGDE